MAKQLLVFLAVAQCFVSVALAATGSIQGRVVLSGEPPVPAVIDPGNDSCCVQAKPLDQRFLVGPDRGLANVVITIKNGESVSKEPPSAAVVMTNEGCAFSPRVTIVRVGQPFVLANNDPTTHNMSAITRRNGAFNLVLPPEDQREMTFDRPETKPATVSCNIHSFMRGYLFILDHPHYALTDETGEFTLNDLPAGDTTLQVWHEGRRVAEAEVRFDDGDPQKTNKRGELSLIVPADQTLRIREIRVPAPTE